MAAYALYVLVIFVINNYYDELHTPMDVFRKFFEVWGGTNFDWDQNLITIYGPIKTINFYERLKNEVRLTLNSFLFPFSATLTSIG